MLSHIEQMPHKEKHFTKALALLKAAIEQEINSPALLKRLRRIEQKVLKYFHANGYELRKAYMVISHLAAALDNAGGVCLNEDTKQVLIDINYVITEGYEDDNIVRQDTSAAKQAPKVLAILQEEGLF